MLLTFIKKLKNFFTKGNSKSSNLLNSKESNTLIPLFNSPQQLQTKEQLNADELKYLMETQKVMILDVRTPKEFKLYHINGAYNLPIGDLSYEKLVDLKQAKGFNGNIVVTYCNAGGRGGKSFTLLKNQQLSQTKDNNSSLNEQLQIKNLTHGINEWINKGNLYN
ncbi:Rhodanese-like domain-containing protein [Candidatus Hepatincolaceae symbiont of Richtersius coronifer]